MAPPSYSDLGKNARDIFSKNYHFSLMNLDVKTKTQNGLSFNVVGNSNLENNRGTAHVEVEQNFPRYNLTFKNKWTTDSVLINDLTLNDKPFDGFKFGVKSTFAPQSGKRSETVKASSKTSNLHINAEVDHDHSGFTCHGAAVFGFQGWLAGAQVTVDPVKKQLVKNSFAFGYLSPEYHIHTSLSNGQDFSGSIYQKVNHQLETSISVAWSSKNDTNNLGIGLVYKPDHSTSFRAKVHNDFKIGLGLTHNLNKGVKVTMCTLLDGKNFNQGGHKVGLGLQMEA